MSTEYERISNAISDIAEDARKASIKTYLDRFKGTNRLDRFEEKFLDFQEYISRAAEDCERAIRSPIYVGVVGHYSHGKSSLLNALLLPPKAKETLPTGDSIVTAMCTLVGFQAGGRYHEFYEVKHDGTEVRLSEEEYQAKVSGKRGGALHDVHHFRLLLGTNELAAGVFQSMAEKRVELLDTPGLGGPYWKDEQALQSWMKEFMLLIVAVKSDAITRRTSEAVNPFIRQTSRPIIPVVTFWDLWQTSDIYKGITTEEDARAKAKDELVRYFPAMADAVEEGRIAFVSARNYRAQQPVADDLKHHITEDWNIDNVRNTLSGYVSDKVSVLQSTRSERSDLDTNRERLVIKSSRELRSIYDQLNAMLKDELERSRPKAGYEEDLDESFERLRDDLLKEYDRIVDRIASRAEDGIGTVSTTGKWNQALHEIQNDIKSQTALVVRESLPERLRRTLDRGVLRSVSRYLNDDAPLEPAKAKRLQQQVSELADDLIEDLTRPSDVSPFVVPQGVTDWSKNMAAALFDGLKSLFTTNLPVALGIVAAIFVVPALLQPVTWVLRFVPGLGDVAGRLVLGLQVVAVGAGLLTLITVSWGQVKRAREMTALQVKEKARKQNRRADIQGRIVPNVEARLKQFESDVLEAMSEQISPLIRAGDDLADQVEGLFKDIGERVRVIDKECAALERRMR